MPIKVTIVIVDYFKAERLLKNVEFLAKQEVDFGFKVIVIDNSCSEKNAKILREGLEGNARVELLDNTRNLGYAGAHNSVRQKIEGDYILTLNPDILLKDKFTLQEMVDYMDANSRVGVLGPLQMNDDGKAAMTVRAFPKFFLQVARRTFLRRLPYLRKRVEYDEMRHLDYQKVQDVDWIQSSCSLVRKSLWDKLGGLDEKYFLFMSDAELCVGAWKNGMRVVFFPAVKVFADGKRVSSGGFSRFFKSWILRQHVWDALKYSFLHCCEKNPREAYYERERRGGQ